MIGENNDGAIMKSRPRSKVPSCPAKKKPLSDKKKYNSAESKKRLLKAALNVFAKEGYDAVTTRTIAKAAQVNDSLIQRYFSSKLGLFFELIREFHIQWSEIPAHEPGESLEEEFANFFRQRLEFARANKKFMRLSITRAIVDPKVRTEISSFARTGIPSLIARLEELRSQGKIKKNIDLAQASRVLSSFGFTLSLMVEVICVTDNESAQALIPIAASIMAEGLKDRKL